MIVSVVLCWVGVFLFMWRVWPRHLKQIKEEFPTPFVSIIIPARDEEKNLSVLLPSLKKLDYPHYEVIVIDDQSSDQTKKVALDFGFKVIEGTSPPAEWVGKNWACHQAMNVAQGELLLFTDADTFHRQDGLKKAVGYFLEKNAALMSALPYHRCVKFWEKLLGPFYAILLAATAPFTPKPRRLFAMGPYLMFSRDSYYLQGGHAAIKNLYPDDLMLANACLKKGGRYVLYYGDSPFEVRMYPTMKEFIMGWRRNFLAGIQQSTVLSFLEVVLIICAMLGAGKLGLGWPIWVPLSVCFMFLLAQQRMMGNFSFLGVLFYPLSILLFCIITAMSWFDYLNGNVLAWKGRSYQGWVK